jgi:hypothetical protein
MTTIKKVSVLAIAATALAATTLLAGGTASARPFGHNSYGNHSSHYGHGPVKRPVPIWGKIWGTHPFKCYTCKGSGFTITHGGNPPVYHPPHHHGHWGSYGHHHWGSYGRPGRFGWTSYGWRYRTYGEPVVYAAYDACYGERKFEYVIIPGFGVEKVVRKACIIP